MTNLYLELLKKVLSFSLWDESLVFVESSGANNRFKGFFKKIFLKMLALKNWKLVMIQSFKSRDEGTIWPAQAHTMIGLKRLNNIQFCVESVIKNNIQGDFIETGVWRGGACIFMRGILKAYNITDRKVFVADSFEGLPKPKHKEDTGDKHYLRETLKVSLEEVRENFRKYGLLDERVVFLKGWFKDTLPIAPIKKLAVLRLDGDMYGSTMDALNNLYPKLSKGGYCIIDDFCLQNCKKAVNEYREINSINSPLIQIDHCGVFWKKE